MFSLYEGTSNPSKPDDFNAPAPVRKIIRDHFTVDEVLTNLERYAKLDVHKQIEVQAGIEKMLAKALELIEKRSTRFQFEFDVTYKIFHLLPKLPTKSTTHSRLVQSLLERFSILVSGKTIKPQFAIGFLAAFAKLSLDIIVHKELIKELLGNLEKLSNRIPHAEDAHLSELWLFLAYARAKQYNNTKVIALFESVDIELASRTQSPTTSKLQQRIDDAVFDLLSPASQQECKGELPVGSYSLDIAFPSCKLNIEVDGPQHYREDHLSRLSKFRDFILRSLGWTIIRIPHFEWNDKAKRQIKTDYLLTRLADHTSILNEAAISRIKYLKVGQVAKPDFMLMDQANTIPEQETKEDLATVQLKKPVTNNFISSSRYLSVVFAEKLAHKRYADVMKSGSTSWSEVTTKNNTFFGLKKIRVKEKHCAGFESVANAADLVLKFKKIESEPGYYKIWVNKTSPGLARVSQIAKAARFFNHDQEDNGNSKILQVIREYEHRP